MSVHVHHGLMDGMHLGQFVDYFQEIMNQKTRLKISKGQKKFFNTFSIEAVILVK
jgi:hypothetical protein